MKRNEIGMIHGTEYKEMTKTLLAWAKLDELICEKKRLLAEQGKLSENEELRIGLKPNLVSPTPASYGATTHPEVVAGIIEYLHAHGYTKLCMLESSWVGDKTEDAYVMCGYRTLSEQYDVPFFDMQKDAGITKDCAGMELSICKMVEKIDFLINVPVLKGHCQTKITCALKNMKGLIPNPEKRRFHSLGLHKPIAHLNVGIKQDFIVVDNICGDLDFEDGGNPYVMNRVLVAADPVLMDAYVCKLLHYEVDDVPYVRMGEELGVGSADLVNALLVSVSSDGDFCEERLESSKSFPKSRKVVELADAVEEVDSCSACYGSLIPALERLNEEGLLEELKTKICIGQGYRGEYGELGIGICTRKFEHSLGGCPPTEEQIYEFLKDYINR